MISINESLSLTADEVELTAIRSQGSEGAGESTKKRNGVQLRHYEAKLNFNVWLGN